MTTETTIKERPIIFNADMVRAVLDGKKTMTRRPIKPQPTVTENGCPRWGTYDGRRMANVPRLAAGGKNVTVPDLVSEYCPLGQPGDRLWVRETFAELDTEWDVPNAYAYRATDDDPNSIEKWTPSTRMHRRASRITLEITGVRVERLRDISEADMKAEGVSNQQEFLDIIAGSLGAGSWYDNVWVWVIAFRKVQ